MKIIIGITQEPQKVKEYLTQRESGSLTEIGPFVSRTEAINWLVYLKSRIADFEEIIPVNQSDIDAVWYGFTYEKKLEAK